MGKLGEQLEQCRPGKLVLINVFGRRPWCTDIAFGYCGQWFGKHFIYCRFGQRREHHQLFVFIRRYDVYGVEPC